MGDRSPDHFTCDVCLVNECLFRPLRTPGRRLRDLGRGQAVDVVLAAPRGAFEINELHVPVGQAVKLTMTSQDVIHSFFVPAFRVKQDVLPNRYTSLWFRPTKVGRYHLFCAEYCGTNHSQMVGWVYVMEPADYERWLMEGGPGPSQAEEGEQLFVRHYWRAVIAAARSSALPILRESTGTRFRFRKARTSSS